MISLPAAPVVSVGVGVCTAVVDRPEVRAAVTGAVTGAARGGRSAAPIALRAMGQIGKASGEPRC